VGRRDQEPLVGELLVEADEELVVRTHRLAGARIENSGRRRSDDATLAHSHSSAPSSQTWMAAIRSVPFERSLPPFVDKSDRQYRKERHHRPEADDADGLEGDGPGKQERDLEVEDDEQDGDQVETHVEGHARIVERIEAALVGRKLLRLQP